MPKESNPGPRLAVLAGMVMVRDSREDIKKIINRKERKEEKNKKNANLSEFFVFAGYTERTFIIKFDFFVKTLCVFFVFFAVNCPLFPCGH